MTDSAPSVRNDAEKIIVLRMTESGAKVRWAQGL